LIRAAAPVPAISRTLAGVLLLLLAAGLAAVVIRGRERLENFLKGSRGEERTARELSFLPADYTVFHGVPVEKSGCSGKDADYDHIVIGPTGVFSIETKNWNGTIEVEDERILFNGKEPDRPPVQQAVRAARGLRKRLTDANGESPEITPVLCFVADTPTLRENPSMVFGVQVCDLASLRHVILGGEHVLGKKNRKFAEDRLINALKRI
jgi:hypothetical protein